jgi:hypothetical protein
MIVKGRLMKLSTKFTHHILAMILLYSVVVSGVFGSLGARSALSDGIEEKIECIPTASADLKFESPVAVGDSLVYYCIVGSTDERFDGYYRFNITEIERPIDGFIIHASWETMEEEATEWTVKDTDIIVGNMSLNYVNWSYFTLIQHKFFLFQWLDADSVWENFIETRYMGSGSVSCTVGTIYFDTFSNATYTGLTPYQMGTSIDYGIIQVRVITIENDSNGFKIYDVWALNNSQSILSVAFDKAFGSAESCIPYQIGDYITYNYTTTQSGTVIQSVLTRLTTAMVWESDPKSRFISYVVNHTDWDEDLEEWKKSPMMPHPFCQITTSSSLYLKSYITDFIWNDFGPVSIDFTNARLRGDLQQLFAWFVESGMATETSVTVMKHSLVFSLNCTSPMNQTTEIQYTEFGYPESIRTIYSVDGDIATVEYTLLPENTSVSICDCQLGGSPDIVGYFAVVWIMGVSVIVVIVKTQKKSKSLG